MSLIKRNIHMDCCQGDIRKQFTLDQDYNIPDIKPDAQTIVKEQGEVRNAEFRANNGKVSVKGEVVFQIVYLSEDGGTLQGLRGSIPFEASFPADMMEQENYSLLAEVEKFNAHLINSRKTSLSAVIVLRLLNQGICDSELAVGVSEDEDVYVQKELTSLSTLTAVKKDTLRARDQWNLPPTKDSIGEFLYWDIRLGELTSRCLENEVQLTGQATVFAMYLSDGEEPEVNLYENTLPVEGVISCNGVMPDMIPRIVTSIVGKDVGVMEDDDGENRTIEAELVIQVDAKVYAGEQVEILTDLYSTKKKCTPIREESSFRNLQTHNISRCRVQGDLDVTSGKPQQVWDVCGSVNIERTTRTPAGLEVEGTLTARALYPTDSTRTPIGTSEGKIPFRQIMDAPDLTEHSTMDLQCRLEQVNGNVAGEKNIQVKAVICFELIAFDKMEHPVVVDVKYEEFEQEKNNMPEMVGYVIQPGDTLWDVAKEYYTTVDRIKEVNKLTSEDVEEGSMILVVN